MKTSAPQVFRRNCAPLQLAILTMLLGINGAQAQAPAPQAAAPVAAQAGAPAAGTASSDSNVIPEVVVTATKRSTSLQRTPIAISALSAATLADHHVQTMLDVVALVPGFQATAQGDHGVTTIDYALPPCLVDTHIATCLDVTGYTMPHAPKFSTTLQYQHTFHMNDGATLVPRITAHYETETELSVFNLGPQDRQKAYGSADLGLRYQDTKGWWVDAFVPNVSDAKITTSAFNGFGPWLSQYKPPRTIGVNTGFDS